MTASVDATYAEHFDDPAWEQDHGSEKDVGRQQSAPDSDNDDARNERNA
jgi:hypothetical protein